MKVEVFIQDGTHVKPGDVAMVVEGKVQSLLQTERLMLNIMQRMSGIATMTNKYVKKLEGTKTRVLDTRKTTPGMRIMEKMAVKIGGGCNHRIGLFDMILLKDNHVDFAGGIHNAVSRAKEYCKAKGKNLKIELEVRNFDELNQALAEGVDRIMFDNFTPEDTRKAVEIVGGRCETESFRWYYLRYYVALCAGRSGFHFFRCADSFCKRIGYELQGLLRKCFMIRENSKFWTSF